MLIIITLGRSAHAWLDYANHLKLPCVISAQDNGPASNLSQNQEL